LKFCSTKRNAFDFWSSVQEMNFDGGKTLAAAFWRGFERRKRPKSVPGRSQEFEAVVSALEKSTENFVAVVADLEQARAQAHRLANENKSLKRANADLKTELEQAKKDVSMLKSIAWEYKGNPPDSRETLLTYTNLVLGQALAVTSVAGSSGESDSKSGGDSDEEDYKTDGESDSEKEGPNEVADVPPTKRARSKSQGPKSQRVRFGEELTQLLRSFLAEQQTDDAEFLQSLLESQNGETRSSLRDYNVQFQTNWRTFATKGTLFSAFRTYYFKLRTSVK
jgi:regulator of replication initiation timing